MATTFDRHTTQTHTTGPHFRYEHTGDKLPYQQQSGPSGTKIMAIMALLPIGGILLGLAGLTFLGTMIGLALATPVFIIFSPVIVPAVLAIGLAVTGFLTSGTFGLTGLSSLSYLVTMLRHSAPYIREDMDYVKDRIQDAGEYAGQKTKEMGQAIKDKAHDIDRKEGGKGGDRT
ncbi:Oleosin [Artemisia annua]|uniref:Oleosin n=1 Tax=Artemisia annua TaxID=35608 RepID=A0A2U1PID7_ARTAN|nr:Oleosin [Artemisia annua]